MREFPTTLFGQPRPRQRPTYRKTTMLDLMRAERRLRDREKALEKMATDVVLRGMGIVRVQHVPHDAYALIH